ncbi:hypothetical protein JCM10212_003789 [Sporobolomyces blumeae]
MDTRRRLAELDPDDDDSSPFEAAPSVSATKLARFTGAVPHTARKSKFERERELEAERAKQQEEEAARAYNEFVEAFGGDDEAGPSTGSTRGYATGRGRGPAKGFVRAGGAERYNPLADMPKPAPPPPPPPSGPKASTSFAGSAIPTGPRASTGVPTGPKAMTAPPKRPTAMSFLDDDEAEPVKKPTAAAMKKKREGDNFLEQLKRDQAAREERLKARAGFAGSSVTALAAREHAPTLTGSGSYDQNDPLTTNVHVGGLPQNVTEESLGRLFAQFGPVGSVKIMWPRLESGQINVNASTGPQGRKLGGFVAFLRRPDAERAAKEMDGAEWGESTLRTGWGKAVPVPSRAIYEPEGGASSHSHRSSRRRRSRSRSPIRSRSESPTDPHEFLRSKQPYRSHRRSSPRSRSPSPGGYSRSRHHERSRAWPVLEPGVEDKFLVTVARKIRDHGEGFEKVLREREKANPKFGFLFDQGLPSFHYFKMLIDRDYEPPARATFDDEGNHDMYSSDSSEDSETERVGKGKLGRLAQNRFESLLRGLTSTRDRIAKGMVFALEHADCAAFIADLLVCSLTIDSTPVPRKLARLHLVSDILHNSSASLPNAWVYRSTFEKRLEPVFDHFGDVYLSFPGRMKAEQFKSLVEKVLDVWANEWLVFEPTVIEGFKRRLSGIDSVAPEDFVEPPPTGAEADGQGTKSELDAPSAAPSPIASTSRSSFVPVSLNGSDSRPASPPTAATTDQGRPGSAHDSQTNESGSGGGFKASFKTGAFKAASFAPAAFTASDSGPAVDAGADDVDGAPIGGDEDVDGEAVADDEVDGAPVEEAEAEDVDGAPMEADDVDGAPLDGEPVETVVLNAEGDDGDAMEMGSEDDDGDIFK